MPEFNSDTCAFDPHELPVVEKRRAEEQRRDVEQNRAEECRAAEEPPSGFTGGVTEWAAECRALEERLAEKQLRKEEARVTGLSAEELRAFAANAVRAICKKDAELKALKADMAALQNKADSAEKKADEEAGRAAKDLAAATDALHHSPVRAGVETVQPAPYTLHPAPCTLHPTPRTVSFPLEKLDAVLSS